MDDIKQWMGSISIIEGDERTETLEMP